MAAVKTCYRSTRKCGTKLYTSRKASGLYHSPYPSDFSCLLAGAVAGAFGVVIGGTHPGGGLLGDEVEHVAQGAVHAVFEAPTQTHIEQRVETAVEIRQAER